MDQSTERNGQRDSFIPRLVRDEQADEAGKLRHVFDALPVNVIVCDRDLVIRSMNTACRNALEPLDSHFSIAPARFVGATIDVFCKLHGQS